MLTTEVFNAMMVYWRQQGRTFCFSLDEAKQFCWRIKLKESEVEIYQHNDRFIIEPKHDSKAA